MRQNKPLSRKHRRLSYQHLLSGDGAPCKIWRQARMMLLLLQSFSQKLAFARRTKGYAKVASGFSLWMKTSSAGSHVAEWIILTRSINILFIADTQEAHNGVDPYRSSPGQFPRIICVSNICCTVFRTLLISISALRTADRRERAAAGCRLGNRWRLPTTNWLEEATSSCI